MRRFGSYLLLASTILGVVASAVGGGVLTVTRRDDPVALRSPGRR